jgi:hypothetical protein
MQNQDFHAAKKEKQLTVRSLHAAVFFHHKLYYFCNGVNASENKSIYFYAWKGLIFDVPLLECRVLLSLAA